MSLCLGRVSVVALSSWNALPRRGGAVSRRRHKGRHRAGDDFPPIPPNWNAQADTLFLGLIRPCGVITIETYLLTSATPTNK